MTKPLENNKTSSIASVASAYGRRQKVFVLITLLVSWILANADRMAMSVAIIPITQEFSLDAKAAGLVLGSFYISYAAMQLVAGWLADRFGSRAVLVFCVGCWSVFTRHAGEAGED